MPEPVVDNEVRVHEPMPEPALIGTQKKSKHILQYSNRALGIIPMRMTAP